MSTATEASAGDGRGTGGDHCLISFGGDHFRFLIDLGRRFDEKSDPVESVALIDRPRVGGLIDEADLLVEIMVTGLRGGRVGKHSHYGATCRCQLSDKLNCQVVSARCHRPEVIRATR